MNWITRNENELVIDDQHVDRLLADFEANKKHSPIEPTQSEFPRESLSFWLVRTADWKFARDSTMTDTEWVCMALNRMHLRKIPIDTETCDMIFGVNGGTSQFFNQAGTVPAEAVIDEMIKQGLANA